MEATSEELNAAPRSLEQVRDELTADWEWKSHDLMMMENRSLPLDMIPKMEALRIEVRRLLLRIEDIEAEISLRRARACVPPLFRGAA